MINVGTSSWSSQSTVWSKSKTIQPGLFSQPVEFHGFKLRIVERPFNARALFDLGMNNTGLAHAARGEAPTSVRPRLHYHEVRASHFHSANPVPYPPQSRLSAYRNENPPMKRKTAITSPAPDLPEGSKNKQKGGRLLILQRGRVKNHPLFRSNHPATRNDHATRYSGSSFPFCFFLLFSSRYIIFLQV